MNDVTLQEVEHQLASLRGVIDRAENIAAVLVAGTQVRYLSALKEAMTRVAELEEDRSARIDAAHEFEQTIADLSTRVAELEAALTAIRDYVGDENPGHDLSAATLDGIRAVVRAAGRKEE